MKKICNMKTLLAAFLLAGLNLTAVQAEEANKKPDVNYSGTYKGAQIIPNEMAIFCKINGEDLYNDASLIRPCLNKIIAKMHNSDAQTAKEGKEDWEKIRVDQLTFLMGDAVAKTAYDADYEKDKDDLQEQTSNTKTEHEDVAAIAYTITSLTDNVSRLISVMAQGLKYSAIEGLFLVDQSVVEDVTDDDAGKMQVNSQTSSTVGVDTGTVTSGEEITAVVPSDDGQDSTGDATGNAAGGAADGTTGNAAGDATGNAAGGTTGNAAGDATGNAAGGTTGNASGDATGNAAGNTAGNTAGNAAGNAVSAQ